jgi:hypothetical protein
VTRLEYGAQGIHPRFGVTNLERPAADLYDDLYCQRGEAENRIQDAQLDLFGTGASCPRFHANGLRLLFAALAHTLMQRLRETTLAGTELARASSLRVRLLKIGAGILRNTRRVRMLLASYLRCARPSSAPPAPLLHRRHRVRPGTMTNNGGRGPSAFTLPNGPIPGQFA